MNAAAQFDADEYYRGGKCPWTFFAFPRAFADTAGFPPDDEAKRLFVALQGQGIPVGTWVNSPVEDTVYFACPKEAIGRLNDALSALEKQGEFEEGFGAKRTEYLFSLLQKSTEPTAEADRGRRPGLSGSKVLAGGSGSLAEREPAQANSLASWLLGHENGRDVEPLSGLLTPVAGEHVR